MKSHFGKLVLIIAIAALAGFAGAKFAGTPKAEQVATKNESVFDRVMRTRTIRCTYLVMPPYLMKDPNTGKFSGIWFDFMEALGTVADLKIEWVAEMNFGTYLQDLEQGKYDMECAGGWPNAKRGQYAFYSKPYAYLPIVTVVRDNDHRFDSDPTTINTASVKIGTIDGETSSVIRNLHFPASQDVSLPQNSTLADMMMNVKSGKADVTFVDAVSAAQFRDANPGTVRIIRYASPLHMVVMSPSLSPDIRLKQMVDVATEQLLNTGKIEQILRTYETEPGQFLRVALPFRD